MENHTNPAPSDDTNVSSAPPVDPTANGSNNPQPSPVESKKRKKKTYLICAVIVALLILIGIVVALILLVFSKHSTTESNMNSKFRVDSISISSFYLSSSQVSATWDIQFSVQNPRNVSVFYQRVDASILYKQQLLSSATIAPFSLRDANWRPMRTTLIAKSVRVNDMKVIEEMAAERANGSLSFNIGFYAGYWIGVDVSQSGWWAVEAFCNDAKVGFSNKDFVGKWKKIAPIECIITKTW